MTLDEAQHLALTVSDLYAERCDIYRDDLWALVKLQEEVGELAAAYLSATGRGRDRGRTPDDLRSDVAAECADVLAQLLIFTQREGIDLNAALQAKWGSHLPDSE